METATLKQKISNLIHSHESPSEIALGVAIGVFIGMLPLYGFHLLLWVIAAFLVPSANKLAIFIGTNISLPVTIPLITWAGYETGRLTMLSREYPPLDFNYFRHFPFRDIGSFYFPLFIGSVILGVVCAFAFYWLTYTIVDARRRRKQMKA
jgi:uncharacterized protein (DUF2062 family)